MSTLHIENVDLADLEEQRKQLIRIIMDDSILSTMDEKQQDALQGLVHMLDAWSDDRLNSGVLVFPLSGPRAWAQITKLLKDRHEKNESKTRR